MLLNFIRKLPSSVNRRMVHFNYFKAKRLRIYSIKRRNYGTNSAKNNKNNGVTNTNNDIDAPLKANMNQNQTEVGIFFHI